MLILFALAFIFIDIPLADGLDIIPDAVGYLLMLIFFLRAVKTKERSVLPALGALAAAALSVFSYFDTDMLWLRVVRFFLLIAAEFFLTYNAYQLVVKRALEKYFPPSDAEIAASKKLLLTGLFLVVCCELALPLAALVHNIANITVLVFLNFAGLIILIVTAKMHNLRQY